MTTNEATKIQIDATSIINLKAELLKKQEEFKLKKLEKSEKPKDAQTTRKSQIWDKKKKEKATKIKKELTKKPETEEISLTEHEQEQMRKSKQSLESKAQYYEELMSGKRAPENGDEELFLVDFERKANETEEEHIKFKDDKGYASVEFNYGQDESEDERIKKFKLKTDLTEDEYKEQLRKKWSEESELNKEKQDIHYQNILFDEARNLGVGYYKFSTTEEERKKQMEFFNDIKYSTIGSRAALQIERRSREKVMKERLKKVKQKRMLKEGYSLEEIEARIRADEMAEAEVEAARLAQEELENEEEEKEAKTKAPILRREWDKPKLKEAQWTQVIRDLRDQRRAEFAPPQIYDGNKAKKGKKQAAGSNKQEPQNVKETKVEAETNENTTYVQQPQVHNFYSTPPPFFFPPPQMPMPPLLTPQEFYNLVPPPPTGFPQMPMPFPSPMMQPPPFPAPSFQPPPPPSQPQNDAT